MVTTRSGNALMKPCAAAAIAERPTDAGPSLMESEPSAAKCAATRSASWLHQAAV